MTGSFARLRATALASLLLGLAYWLGSPARTDGPQYDAVRDVMPMWAWGALLTAISGPLLWAVGRHTWTTALTAALGTGWHTAWFLLFVSNALTSSNVAWAGAIVFGFLAYLHISLALAAARDLADRED